MKLDVTTQLEFPGERIDRFPGFGQTGHQLLTRPLQNQAAEDLPCHLIVRRQVMEIRVH